MRFIPSFNRVWLATIFGAAVATGLGLFLHLTRFGGGVGRTSYDLLHVARGDIRANEAVIIYMDDPSYDKLRQPLNLPWDRALHARLIDRLTAAGASVIVFDIVFTDPDTNNPAADLRFAEAMKKSGRVILAADNVLNESKVKKIYRPFDLLLDSAVGMGSAETLPEADVVIRRHTPEEQIHSLSWVAAEFVKAGVTQQEGQSAVRRWINYYGAPGMLTSRSYHLALDPEEVPDEFFRGKAVFIGGRLLTKLAAHRKDEFANPFSFWSTRELLDEAGGFFAAGVEIQATTFLNLLRGDWLRRLPEKTEWALIVGVGLLFGAGLVWLRPFVAISVALPGLAVLTAGCYWLFVRELTWFPWLIPILQGVVALSWSLVFNSVQFYVDKRLMEHTLAVYLSPKLVKKFARRPELLRPGAEKQIITIFFTDIADFTSISQGLDSDELAEFMNRYFQNAVSKCIHQTDGTVVKYLGDAIFAFWNAPEEQTDHALRACLAALKFRELGEAEIKGRRVRTRIGIHTGEANVGNFGSLERVDYTALGENVNLASRLEGLNKYTGTDCLISRETKAAIGDRLITRRLGLFRLKGFDRAVEVHEILGQPEVAEATRAWSDSFGEALRLYEAGDIVAARSTFQRTLELKPGDGASTFYLERLSEMKFQSIGADWTGETQIHEK